MDFSCRDIRELLDSTISKWFENPGDKSPNLDDLGIQLDCNDTTKDTSKDTKERFVEPSVIPQVYVNEYNEDIDPTWTNMENAKWASKKEADLVGETDQDGDVFMYNYRSDQEEPKKDLFTDEIYPSGIEPRFYMKAEEETSPTSVVNNVVDNVKDSVSEKVTPQVGGSSGTPRMYGTKPSGDKQMKNYAFELTTIEKIADEIIVEADLESKKPYLLKDLEKSKFDKKDYDQIIDICNDMDPTGKRAVFTQWILRRHALDGEEFSGVESSDYLQKFLELKKSKKLQNADADINHYKSFADLKAKVDQVLEETGGSVNNKTKKELSEKNGIKLLDSEGDLELYVVNTYEAARKEFEGTGWCVAYPDSYKAYSDTNPNFYYVKKGGKPFYLLHEIDAQGVGNTQPPYEELESTIGLLAKNNLLTMNLGFGLDLLRRQHITKEENPEIYQDIVDSVVGSSIGSAYNLVYWGVVTNENDPENYQKIINACLEDGKYADALLCRHFIDNDSPLFEQAVKKAIEVGKGFNLLKSKVITKETTPDLYDEALRVEVDGSTHNHNELDLLRLGFITKDDTPDLFESAIKKCMDNLEGFELVIFEILTLDEYNEYKKKFGIGDDDSKEQYEQPLDESTNDDTNKESAFEFTDINKLADFVQEFNRQDELTDEQKNKFVNRLPVEEVNKDQKEELMEKAKKVNKPVTYIPKDLNFPFIEDEMAGNKLFYTDTDFLLDDLYQ